ncbi:MAG TPA: VacJ family lipoprotein [Caulobacteraceae bacterium]|nr:VacJ family lipoprotein [Caulobacteraceae bacterium]
MSTQLQPSPARRASPSRWRRRLTTVAAVGVLGLAARAHADPEADAAERPAPAAPVSDPAEKVNRAAFAVDQTLDRVAIAPTARVYRAGTPHPVREMAQHFAGNLREPTVFIAETLQAHPRRAATAVGRFVVNSTVGVGGLFDLAGHMGMPPHETDMGVTLGRWGVPPGPTVEIPILGPSNMRDATGGLLGVALDPATYVSGGVIPVIHIAGTVVGTVDARARRLPLTDELHKTSPDYYASLRDRNARGRAAKVREAQGHRDPDAESHAPEPAGDNAVGG